MILTFVGSKENLIIVLRKIYTPSNLIMLLYFCVMGFHELDAGCMHALALISYFRNMPCQINSLY
jgi:hypothetical protein